MKKPFTLQITVDFPETCDIDLKTYMFGEEGVNKEEFEEILTEEMHEYVSNNLSVHVSNIDECWEEYITQEQEDV